MSYRTSDSVRECVRPLVHPSVRWSVRRSVGQLVTLFLFCFYCFCLSGTKEDFCKVHYIAMINYYEGTGVENFIFRYSLHNDGWMGKKV